MKIAAGSHTLAGILFWIIFAADLLICGDLSTVTDAAMLKTMFIVQMNRSAHCLRIASLFMTANFILRYHLILILVFIHANYLHTIWHSFRVQRLQNCESGLFNRGTAGAAMVWFRF